MSEISETPTAAPDEGAGIPHAPGTSVKQLTVTHPETGESQWVLVPADHDGSRVKVEFPAVKDAEGNVVTEGATAYTEGFDPAERAATGERPVVPCGNCGAPQTLTQSSFTCSACGKLNTIELKTSRDEAVATHTEQA